MEKDERNYNRTKHQEWNILSILTSCSETIQLWEVEAEIFEELVSWSKVKFQLFGCATILISLEVLIAGGPRNKARKTHELHVSRSYLENRAILTVIVKSFFNSANKLEKITKLFNELWKQTFGKGLRLNDSHRVFNVKALIALKKKNTFD